MSKYCDFDGMYVDREFLPGPDQGKFAIQTHALKDIDSAQTTAQEYRAMGFPAYATLRRTSNGECWYKVFISAYSNLDETFHALNQLEEKGISSFVINRK